MTIYNTLAGSAIPAVRDVYDSGKRRDLFFVGDSITWGYGVNSVSNSTTDVAFPRRVQEAINTRLGYSDAGWVAKNVMYDDTSTLPFNGGLPPSGIKLEAYYNGTTPFQISFKGVVATTGSLPGSATINDAYTVTAGGNLLYVWNSSSWVNTGPAQVGPFGGYGFALNSTPYGSPGYAPPPVRLFNLNDGVACAMKNSGSQVFLLLMMVRVRGTSGTVTLRCFAEPGGFSQDLTLSVDPSTVQRPIFGISPTFPAGANRVSVYLNSRTGDGYVDILAWQPTPLYPNGTFVNVHVNGRNSHQMSDYNSNISDIASTVIHTDAPYLSPPIYVLSIGTVAMYAGAGVAVTPANYQTQLNTLATGLAASSSGASVVLTLPPIPTGGTWQLPAGTTRAEYDSRIIELANTLGVRYVDLRPVLDPGDYQGDGIHPTAAGHQKLANAYVQALRL